MATNKKTDKATPSKKSLDARERAVPETQPAEALLLRQEWQAVTEQVAAIRPMVVQLLCNDASVRNDHLHGDYRLSHNEGLINSPRPSRAVTLTNIIAFIGG